MFECRACLLRSLRALAGDVANVQPAVGGRARLSTLRRQTPPIRRTASTAVATKDVETSASLPDIAGSNGDALDQMEKKRPYAIPTRDQKALKMELQYLSDPLKLAEHVRYTLRCNKPDKALNLCRLASKQQEVIVSWNHCVDWHMSHGKINAAIDIYNEMKKRAQFPDSYTYILLLRGLAKPHHHGALVKQENVVKAMSIYGSMSNPTSRVKPSVYHTNAMLKVCSAALDIDALWTVAAKLPSSGPNAPDHITYAILLNAIRHGALGHPLGAQLDQIATRRQEAVNQGRRIWQEIIPKWRAGEVRIDEELVCAMGRLLLISKRLEDLDDVLSLVQQTMNIERQIAPVGSANRHTEHIPEISAPGPAEEPAEDAEGYRDAPSTKAFNSVIPLPPDSAHPKRPTTLAYVTPGNPTLSMIVGTCQVLRTPKTANAYWDLLTSVEGRYGLKPDLPNFHALFRLLGINRSSARAVQILRSMPDNNLTPNHQTFRIVMSVCVRDKNNHNSIDHARAVVDEMTKHCTDPDMHTLIQYLSLALTTDDGLKIASTLERLDIVVRDLCKRMDRDTGGSQARGSDTESRAETLSFLKALVGAIDTLLQRRLVPEKDFEHWHDKRSELTKLIGRVIKGQDARAAERQKRHKQPKLDSDDPFDANAPQGGMRRRGGPELRMSNAEFQLRKLRWRENREGRREAGRQRAIGLKNWDARLPSRQRPKEYLKGVADSPLELGVRD